MRREDMFESHFPKRTRLCLLLVAAIAAVVLASSASGGHNARAEMYIDGVEIGSLAIDELGDREPRATCFKASIAVRSETAWRHTSPLARAISTLHIC